MSVSGGHIPDIQEITAIQNELVESIDEGDILKLEDVLQETSIDLNHPLADGRLLLNIAVQDGQKDIVEILLRHGASVAACDGDGNIALHYAVKKNRNDIGALLLRNEARQQLCRPNTAGDTPHDLILSSRSKQAKWSDLIAMHAERTTENTVEEGGAVAVQPSTNQSVASNRNNTEAETVFLADGYDITADVGPEFLGKLYQLNILTLLSLHSYKNERYAHFRLATEVAACLKFDDVVFEYEGLKLVQIKHRTKNEIAEEDLFKKSPKQTKKPALGVAMFFDSFCKLQDEVTANTQELIVLTNTSLKSNCFELDQLDRNHILNIGIDSVKRWKLKRGSVKEKLKSEYERDFLARKFNEADLESFERHFELFCQKFCFVTNFPNEEASRELVKEKARKLFKLSSPEIADNCFFQRMQKWYKELEAKAISESLIAEFYGLIDENISVLKGVGLHNSNCDKLPQISFDSIHLALYDFIQSEAAKLLIIRTPSLELTSRKVVNQLQSDLVKFPNQDDFMFILSRDITPPVSKSARFIAQAFGSQKSFKVLVACCASGTRLDDVFTCFSSNFFNSNKKIVFITNENIALNGTSSILSGSSPDTLRDTDDDPSFSHFSQESQQDFMDREIIFQGRNLPIRDVMGDKVVNEVFEPHHLFESMASQSKIEIHSDWSWRLTDAYIERRLIPVSTSIGKSFVLHRNTEGGSQWIITPQNTNISLALYRPKPCEGNSSQSPKDLDPYAGAFVEQHFYTPKRTEKVVIVSGDPGSGKSLLFSSLQQNMSRLNANTWPILFNLNDFAHDAQRENHLSRITFLESETDKAIEFVCRMVIPSEERSRLSLGEDLTRNLLRICLLGQFTSQPLPKVVLLFDGYDEIAPKYTPNAIRLFRSLRLVNCEQLWISTRDHQVQALFEDLLVKYEAELEIEQKRFDEVSKAFSMFSRAEGSQIYLEHEPINSLSKEANSNAAKLLTVSLHGVDVLKSDYTQISASPKNEHVQVNVEMEPRSLVSLLKNYKQSAYFKQLLSFIRVMFPELSQPNENVINFVEIPHDQSKQSHADSDFSGTGTYSFDLQGPNTFITLTVGVLPSRLRICAHVTRTKVFDLIKVDSAQQAEFLFKCCRTHKSAMTGRGFCPRTTNMLTLFSVIDYKFDECRQKLADLLQLEEQKLPAKIFGQEQSNLKTLLQTPLHLSMLAELALHGQLELNAGIGLHQLYSAMISMKENIYLRDKQKLGDNADETFRATVEKVRAHHRMMARCLLLDERVPAAESSFASNEQLLLKFGLTISVWGKQRFIHRSFAEYIFAEELCQTIREAGTQRILFERVFEERRFIFVRLCLDSILSEEREFKDLSIPVPYIPQYHGYGRKVKTYASWIKAKTNILRLLLRTLVSESYSCYEFLTQKLLDTDLFVASDDSEKVMKILADESNFNPHTLGCLTEVLSSGQRQSRRIIVVRSLIQDMRPTYLDLQRILLQKDPLGNTVLHGKHSEYFLKHLKRETARETLGSLALHKNCKGESFLHAMGRFNKVGSFNVLKCLPEDCLQKLVESTDNKGHTFLFTARNEIDILSDAFKCLGNFMKFSDDFLIITIYDNFFHSGLSLNDIFTKLTIYLPRGSAYILANEQKAGIRDLIRKNKTLFETNLAKLNEALGRGHLEDLEVILNDSKVFVREIVLASSYKEEQILQNSKVISKLGEHLENHTVVHHHWILRVLFTSIECDCFGTFSETLKKAWLVLESMETSSLYALLLEHIWTSISFDRLSMLQMILKCVEASERLTVEDLFLYNEEVVLRYDVDVNRSCQAGNATGKLLFDWFSDHIDGFREATLVELLAFNASYETRISCTEDQYREKLFAWLCTGQSITRDKTHRILFGAARFGFKTIVRDLLHWIEEHKNKLSFGMIDLITYITKENESVLELAANQGLLSTVMECFEKSNYNSKFLQLFREKDYFDRTILHKIRRWSDIQKVIPIVVQEFGWDFLLSENYRHDTFLSEHAYAEFLPDLLLLLKKHSTDSSQLKELVLPILTGTISSCDNFLMTINFCLENFPDEFEDAFLRKDRFGNLIFDHILKGSYANTVDIFHFLLTRGDDRCRTALLGFMKEYLSTNSTHLHETKVRDVLGFACKEYSQGEVEAKFGVFLPEFEDLFLKVLLFSEATVGREKWTEMFLNSANKQFSDILKSAFHKLSNEEVLTAFVKEANHLKGNVLHGAFKNGIALRALEVVPRSHLKRLLCELDYAGCTPFHYLQGDEDMNNLVTFLAENVADNERDEVLEGLSFVRQGRFHNQLPMD